MTTKCIVQNIDLWEAWVDVQTTSDGTRATLYVIGDVCVNNSILEARFEKIAPEAGTEHCLQLQIVPNILCEEGLETEVLYAEDLQHPEQYRGVQVFVGQDLLVAFDEIELIY